MCDECTFLVQLYWHWAIRLYCSFSEIYIYMCGYVWMCKPNIGIYVCVDSGGLADVNLPCISGGLADVNLPYISGGLADVNLPCISGGLADVMLPCIGGDLADVNLPCISGGLADVNLPCISGGLADVNLPCITGGLADVNLPCITGGLADVNLPCITGGLADVNLPCITGGLADVKDKAFQRLGWWCDEHYIHPPYSPLYQQIPDRLTHAADVLAHLWVQAHLCTHKPVNTWTPDWQKLLMHWLTSRCRHTCVHTNQ